MEIEYNDLINYHHLKMIDLRSSYLYQKKPIQDAVNIPFDKLLINPEKYLNQNEEYLLICEYGIKSKKTSAILNKMGYKTYSLKQGIRNLI